MLRGKEKRVNVALPEDTTTGYYSIHQDRNFFPDIRSNVSLCYGFNDDWGIGLNAYGITGIGIAKDASYDVSLLASIERTIKYKQVSANIGINIGNDIASSDTNTGLDLYSYANALYSFDCM